MEHAGHDPEKNFIADIRRLSLIFNQIVVRESRYETTKSVGDANEREPRHAGAVPPISAIERICFLRNGAQKAHVGEKLEWLRTGDEAHFYRRLKPIARLSHVMLPTSG